MEAQDIVITLFGSLTDGSIDAAVYHHAMSAQTSFITGNFDEPTFNSALAEVLRKKRHYWRSAPDAVTSQKSGVLLGNAALRPDILIQPRRGNPIIIEVEIDSDPFPDARSRIGKKTNFNKTIYSTIGLKAPASVRSWSSHEEAVARLADLELDFGVVQQGASGEIERWPRENFLTGDADDLADLCEIAATPHHMIETFAESMAKAIMGHADALEAELHPDVAQEIAEAIGQPKVKQGLRLACCIWMSTLRLHDLLAGTDELKQRGLKSIGEIRAESVSGDSLPLAEVREAWNTVLEYNYRSVFRPALNALVPSMPEVAGSTLLDNLARLATQVDHEGLGDHVDFAGELFPKLLEDRKVLKANYTLPTIATLLARLAVDRIPIEDWQDLEIVKNIRFADFACGTGTLLRAAYRRIRKRYESAGGEQVRSLHRTMMEESITGTDINVLAAHMTAAGLSAVEIDRNYDRTNIGALPIQGGKTGALELLAEEQISDLMAQTVEQSSQEDVGATIAATNNSYDLVIQNPPYSSAGADRERMFDIAGLSEVERQRSVKQLTGLRNGIRRSGVDIIHGRAGMGADFSALADLKLADDGIFASVLPLTAAHGETWSDFRAYFAANYRSLTAITFATDEKANMSSDTGMNEMLLLAAANHQQNPRNTEQNVLCVNLTRSPVSIADSQAIAAQIQRVESVPGSAGLMHIAGSELGSWVRQPLPNLHYPWFALGMRNRHLAEASSRLLNGELALHAFGTKENCNLPFLQLSEVVEIGPESGQIGHVRGGDGRGTFTFDLLLPGDVTLYPSMWHASSEAQKTLIVAPTHAGDPVSGREDRVPEMLKNL